MIGFWSDIVLGDATILIVWAIIIFVFWKLFKMFVKNMPDRISFIIFSISVIVIFFGLIFLILIGITELIVWIFLD